MPSVIKFALRFILVCLILLAIFYRYGETLLEQVLPLYKWEISALDDQYQVTSLSLTNEGADRVLKLSVNLARPLFIGTVYRLPDERGIAYATTNAGHAWQLPIIFLALILAWPIKHLPELIYRVAVAIPLLLLLTAVDIPLALLASLWDLILYNLAPDTFSLLVLWGNFLLGGGRLALGISGGIIVIAFTNILLGLKCKDA